MAVGDEEIDVAVVDVGDEHIDVLKSNAASGRRDFFEQRMTSGLCRFAAISRRYTQAEIRARLLGQESDAEKSKPA